jgi:hypothetical protein
VTIVGVYGILENESVTYLKGGECSFLPARRSSVGGSWNLVNSVVLILRAIAKLTVHGLLSEALLLY